jgi:hypothetical protein
MHHEMRTLLRDNHRRAEQRTRGLELSIMAIIVIAVALLRQRRRYVMPLPVGGGDRVSVVS